MLAARAGSGWKSPPAHRWWGTSVPYDIGPTSSARVTNAFDFTTVGRRSGTGNRISNRVTSPGQAPFGAGSFPVAPEWARVCCVTHSGNVSTGGAPDVRDLPDLTITKVFVGLMDNNAHLLRRRATGEQLLIDAANDADRLLEVIGEPGISTRGHHPPAS